MVGLLQYVRLNLQCLKKLSDSVHVAITEPDKPPTQCAHITSPSTSAACLQACTHVISLSTGPKILRDSNHRSAGGSQSSRKAKSGSSALGGVREWCHNFDLTKPISVQDITTSRMVCASQ